MNRNITKALIPLVVLCTSGCFFADRAADRTLKLDQLQSNNTYLGPFEVDTSRLPADAIESRTEKAGVAGPVTSLKIRSGYPVKVMLVPMTQPNAGSQAK